MVKAGLSRKFTSFAAVALCTVFGVFVVQSQQVSARGKVEPPIPPQEFVAKFFETPLEKMSNINNSVYKATWGREPRWTGVFVFDCDTVPVLKDQAQYKPAGDVIEQIDSNLALFGRRAFPLLHSKDVECIHQLWNSGMDATYNTLTYNRKTKTYFFHHNNRAFTLD